MKINLLSKRVVGPGMLALVILSLGFPLLWVEDHSSPTLFEEDLQRLGIPFETHQIPTADGFILTAHRLVQTGNSTTQAQPLLMLHGLDEVAQIWVMNDKENSVGAALYREGYDVWMLNNRGTAYSKAHASLSPGSSEFWDYSFQELGQYDVTAVVNYISRANAFKKIITIGHSQGATQALAALTDPQTSEAMNSKISGVIGLCPVGHMGSLPTKTKVVLQLVKGYVHTHQLLSSPWPRLSSQTKTLYKKGMRQLCDNVPLICNGILWMAGYDSDINKPELLSKVFEVLPGGASFRAYLHFAQLAESALPDRPLLRKFDFGPQENQKRYGQTTPPEYDWSRLSVPFAIKGGDKDILSPPENLKLLHSHLKQLKKEVSLELFSDTDHFTPFLAKDNSKLLRSLLAEVREMSESSNN